MKKIVVTGIPRHSNSDKLFEHLRRNHDEYFYVPDPAVVIAKELNPDRKSIKGKHLNLFSLDVAKYVYDREVELEEAIPTNTDVAIVQRSLVDFLSLERTLMKRATLALMLHRSIENAEYHAALLCDLSADQATKSPNLVRDSRVLEATYQGFGVEVIRIPHGTHAERLSVAETAIQGFMSETAS